MGGVKLNKEHVFLLSLFLVAFTLWSLPYVDNQMPFGEGDASYHFSMGDYQYTQDKSLGIQELPPYICYRYYGVNTKLGPMTLQLPPTLHLSYGISSVIGRDRFTSQNVFVVLSSILIIFTFYILFRKLYGFHLAACVSVALLFSVRSIFTYFLALFHINSKYCL